MIYFTCIRLHASVIFSNRSTYAYGVVGNYILFHLFCFTIFQRPSTLKAKRRYDVVDSDDSAEEGEPSDSDFDFITGTESDGDHEYKQDKSPKKKKSKSRVSDAECDVVEENSDEEESEDHAKLNASEIRKRAEKNEKLQELFESGIYKFRLSLPDVVFDRKEINATAVFKPNQELTWAEAMKMAKHNTQRAKILLRQAREDNRLRSAAEEAWKKNRVYRGRYAKVAFPEKQYSFNNPVEKNVVNLSARTLQEHFYEHCVEPLHMFGKPPQGKEWPVKRNIRKRKRTESKRRKESSTKRQKRPVDEEKTLTDKDTDEASI